MTKSIYELNEDVQVTWWDKICLFYWGMVPYDYRPGQIWYRFKCWLWKRYSTIKPRYLPHTWCDRVELLPHMMFEVLSQFIEKECSPGMVDWQKSGHSVIVDGKEVNVRDEMQDLYDWWHQIYNKEYPERMKQIYAESEHEEWPPNKPITEDFWTRRASRLETKMENELMTRMIRLCKVQPYMWT